MGCRRTGSHSRGIGPAPAAKASYRRGSAHRLALARRPPCAFDLGAWYRSLRVGAWPDLDEAHAAKSSLMGMMNSVNTNCKPSRIDSDARVMTCRRAAPRRIRPVLRRLVGLKGDVPPGNRQGN